MDGKSDKSQIEEALSKRELSLEYLEFEMERLGMRCYLVVSKNRVNQKQVWRVVIDDEPHVQLGTGTILHSEEWAANQHPGELAMMSRAGHKLYIQNHIEKQNADVQKLAEKGLDR